MTSFIAFSALMGFLIFTALVKLTGVYDLESHVKSIDLVVRLVSLGLTVLIFAVLNWNETANQFMHEAVAELSRVTWPTNKETTSATFVVLIMVLITGLVLGLLDKFWTLVIQWIL